MIDPCPPVVFEKAPCMRTLSSLLDTVALPDSVPVPNVRMKETVVPTTVPFIVSTPTGETMTPVNAPLDWFSVVMVIVSTWNAPAKKARTFHVPRMSVAVGASVGGVDAAPEGEWNGPVRVSASAPMSSAATITTTPTRGIIADGRRGGPSVSMNNPAIGSGSGSTGSWGWSGWKVHSAS